MTRLTILLILVIAFLMFMALIAIWNHRSQSTTSIMHHHHYHHIHPSDKLSEDSHNRHRHTQNKYFISILPFFRLISGIPKPTAAQTQAANQPTNMLNYISAIQNL